MFVLFHLALLNWLFSDCLRVNGGNKLIVEKTASNLRQPYISINHTYACFSLDIIKSPGKLEFLLY